MSYDLIFAKRIPDDFENFLDRYFEYFPNRHPEIVYGEVNEALSQIRINPYIRQVDELPYQAKRPVRHVTVWKFHFYYVVREDTTTVEVAAIVHEASGPAKMRDALRG